MSVAFEIADTWEKKTIWQKLLISIIIIAVIFGVIAIFYYVGVSRGKKDSQLIYDKKTEELEKKVTQFEERARVHDENEQRLEGENALLRKDAEAKAEILRQNDDKLKGDAHKLDDLEKERQKKVEEINIDNDFANQVKELCKSYKASGFDISFCKDK